MTVFSCCLNLLLIYSFFNECKSQNATSTTSSTSFTTTSNLYTTTQIDDIAIKIGGLFYQNTAQYYAFLQAIKDVNDNSNLLNGYYLEPVIEFHGKNFIVEASNLLSKNPSIVIGPPSSDAIKKISPLFSLTNVPLIGYSSTASTLSDTDIYPFFYRVIPDVSDLIGPIIKLFQHYGWAQAVLIHGAGSWGHGLDELVYLAGLNDIVFPVTIEIAHDSSISDIEQLLSNINVDSFEVFVVHTLKGLRENIFTAAYNLGLLISGNAWLGTEDIATSLNSETLSTIAYMQGVIAIRPITPNITLSQTLKDYIELNKSLEMSYYAYYVYDAVVTVSHALDFTLNQGYDVTQTSELNPNDYFGNITTSNTNGAILAQHISSLQLPPDWLITGALYMSGNTRKTSYELVNILDGKLNVIAKFSWDTGKIKNWFNNLNGSDPQEGICDALDAIAKWTASDEYKELNKYLYVKNKTMTDDYNSQYKAAEYIIDVWNECFVEIMGIERVYSLSETANDYAMTQWIFNENTTFIGNTTNIPIGALWKRSEPLKVLAWLIEPWGNIIWNNGTMNGTVNVYGFLPTIWENITSSFGIKNTYYYEHGLTANEAINKVSSGKYDIALGAFTVTEERTIFVNFIHQFYGGGLKILIRKPPSTPTLFMFLRPFHYSLWAVTGLTVVVVAGIIYLLEWDTDTFLDDDGKKLSFIESFIESVTISSSVLFYTHEAPRGIHTRVFVLLFQYMILVLIAAYTANMAAFLTSSGQPIPQIQTFQDLYAESVSVGTLSGSFAESVLENKGLTRLKNITLCQTTDECLNEIINQQLTAFVFDDANIDYWVSTTPQCNLIAPGDSFNSVSFAFPTTFNVIPDQIIDELNIAMIELWSKGFITDWIEQFITSQQSCHEYTVVETEDTEAIGISDFFSMFICIAAFSILFCCILILQPKIEKFMQSAQNVKEDNNHKNMQQLVNQDSNIDGDTNLTQSTK